MIAILDGERVRQALRNKPAPTHPPASLGLGSVIIMVLIRFPLLGFVILAAVGLAGAEAAIACRFGSREPWSLRPLLEGLPL